MSKSILTNLSAGIFLLFLTAHAGISQKTYVEKSTDLVNAVRFDRPTEELRQELATVDADRLAQELDDDNARKTFWINVYNAHVQIFLTEEPALFDDRPEFFKAPRVTVAGEKLSFDEIEHGIIRRSKAKLGLGIFPKLCPSKFERKFRVKKTDPRIHLALNCGAKSCPPVAAYEYERLDEQLDESSRRLLAKTTDYRPEKNEVEVIALFSWFRGDWGNKNKVRKFLKKYDAIPDDAKPSIQYAKYDWTLMTGNYIDL